MTANFMKIDTLFSQDAVVVSGNVSFTFPPGSHLIYIYTHIPRIYFIYPT